MKRVGLRTLDSMNSQGYYKREFVLLSEEVDQTYKGGDCYRWETQKSGISYKILY